ncbi:MAG: IS200/IS605 family element RNA-guided endonuclease TnpB [Clostridia bacterium]|jgi:putative transposase
MKQLKAFKYKLEPNQQQKVLINKTLGCCRLIYNQMLNESQEKYLKKDKSKNKTEKEYKELFSFMKEVDSISLQQSRLDLTLAYKNFFRKLKSKEKTSLKFKSKRNPKNSYRTINISNSIRIEENRIKLPKLGFVKFKKSREILGNIKSVTISKNILNKYYISILSEVNIEELPKNNNKIGIDLGLKEFCITSNNNFISNPKYLRKLELKLKKAQKKLSKRVKNSINRFKQQKVVFRIHEKIRNQRLDFLHKLSSKLIHENQVICLEDLQVKNMVKNHKLAKSISDVSWSKFVELLVYKALWYKRIIIKIDKFFPSSKMCNNCKSIKHDLTLQDRIYNCPHCGLVIDRDYNSSLNILEEGLRILNSGRDDRDSLLNIETLVSSS